MKAIVYTFSIPLTGKVVSSHVLPPTVEVGAGVSCASFFWGCCWGRLERLLKTLSVDFFKVLLCFEDEDEDEDPDILDSAITVSHFLIGGWSSSSRSYLWHFTKLLVEKFLWIGFSDEEVDLWDRLALIWPPVTASVTRFLRLGTLGISDIDVRVSQRRTCWLPDNASVLVKRLEGQSATFRRRSLSRISKFRAKINR